MGGNMLKVRLHYAKLSVNLLLKLCETLDLGRVLFFGMSLRGLCA